MKKSDTAALKIPKDVRNRLEPHFDELVASMQRPQQEVAIEKLFQATSEELGVAAVRGASRKKRSRNADPARVTHRS